MIQTVSRTNLSIGGLAFLAGVLATIVTAYAVVSKKAKTAGSTHDHYDGWEEGLGV